MKLHALCASAVALTLAFASPALAVTKADKEFALLASASWVVIALCPQYDMVDGAPRKTADRNGADFDTVGPAVVAAMMAQMDKPYERADMIPEISITVRDVVQDIMQDVRRSKPAECRKWGEAISPAGMIKLK
ncbi:hypothetical protein QA639_21260 [Bradyrhizobium pachyrhizi]|uniref:hypothetical protein n=1 Tax=Bradyrhizobium pachyrhizi TaxID=280333 RepID=UPI0024B03B6D|nr:hypothetical protein [Bradyrhizobium pachyrhizi]WFU52239.1 hypothetical protein QA639_21260 [Bradyrhizobium pachyrhizi]